MRCVILFTLICSSLAIHAQSVFLQHVEYELFPTPSSAALNDSNRQYISTADFNKLADFVLKTIKTKGYFYSIYSHQQGPITKSVSLTEYRHPYNGALDISEEILEYKMNLDDLVNKNHLYFNLY